MAFHSYLTVIVPALIAFIVTVVSVMFVRGYIFESGIVAQDKNKPGNPTLPTSGGVAVAFGFTVGLLVYVAGNSFLNYSAAADPAVILASVLSIVLITFVGFLDDINVKKQEGMSTGMRDTRKGLAQWQKPILSFIGTLPIIAINAGISTIHLPIVGPVDFGAIYPIVIVPLAIVFVANAFNLLEGFNGIGSGGGVIASLALLVYSFLFGTYAGVLLSAVLFGSLLAFLYFNAYPAKILPGDSLTYCIGTAIAVIVILGNMEAFGLVLLIPWILEFVLHASQKFKVTDLGKRRKDGTFAAPYGKKVYSLTHFVMNLAPLKEWEVTNYVWGIEAAFAVLAFALKFAGLM